MDVNQLAFELFGGRRGAWYLLRDGRGIETVGGFTATAYCRPYVLRHPREQGSASGAVLSPRSASGRRGFVHDRHPLGHGQEGGECRINTSGRVRLDVLVTFQPSDLTHESFSCLEPEGTRLRNGHGADSL